MKLMDYKERVDLGEASSMLLWFPKIAKLDIPQIKTEMITVGNKPLSDLVRKNIPLKQNVIDEFNTAIDKLGIPVFMRSDQASMKHSWKDTCYLDSKNNLIKNLSMLIEEHEMASLGGELRYDAIVFREFIPMESTFTCFYNGFPVNKEVRCFIKDGKIKDLRHYWVKNAIAEGRPDDKDWEKKLKELKNLTKDDVDEIKKQLLKVCPVFPEYWSVDFAKGTDGVWYMIDMARGDVSYQSDEIIEVVK